MKKELIGIIGENGSGKDTFCEFLRESLSSERVEFLKFSDPLTEVLHIFFDKVSREDQQWLVNNLRERFGKDILTKAIEKKIKQSKKEICVLNGIRVFDDYLFLKEKEGYLIYVTASKERRWERLNKRGEKRDDRASFEEFLKKEDNPTERDIPEIGKYADFVVDNNSGLGNLKEQALEVIKKINEKG